jgi:prepilin-type N-terminal cleavage/methylation domain-containing protein
MTFILWAKTVQKEQTTMLRTGSKGFTLIEIMLAVLILSFGLVLVLRSFATALDGLKRSENVKVASYLLEEKMEDIKEKAREGGGVTEGYSSGEVTISTPRECKWSIEVVPSGVDENLNKVELVISWTEGKSKRSLFATTYLENQD